MSGTAADRTQLNNDVASTQTQLATAAGMWQQRPP